MPSVIHDFPAELLRRNVKLAEILIDETCRVPLPVNAEPVVESADLTDCPPTEARADSVVVWRREGTPVLAAAIEVQRKIDAEKRWSWPAYLANLRRRYHCDAEVLVVCFSNAVAEWAEAPIKLNQTGSAMTVQAVGPRHMPWATDTAEAQDCPELAVLSAAAHGDREDGGAVLNAWIHGLKSVEPTWRKQYLGFGYGLLSEPTQLLVRTMMVTMVKDDSTMSDIAAEGLAQLQADFRADALAEGRAESRAKGRAEGEALLVLRVLERRGIDVSEAVREQLFAERDLDRLEELFDRAFEVTSADELFD